jgi:hypothetical protein
MRRVGAWLVALVLLSVVSAEAASWGGITPGTTRRADVERRYGRPTEERQVTEGGLIGAEWTYAGTRAPAGLDRMVIGLGLVGPSGFVPDLVRMLVLYPKPRVFTVGELVTGWGKPDGIGTDERTGRSLLRWEGAGIVAYLDASGEYAEVLIFALATP